MLTLVALSSSQEGRCRRRNGSLSQRGLRVILQCAGTVETSGHIPSPFKMCASPTCAWYSQGDAGITFGRPEPPPLKTHPTPAPPRARAGKDHAVVSAGTAYERDGYRPSRSDPMSNSPGTGAGSVGASPVIRGFRAGSTRHRRCTVLPGPMARGVTVKSVTCYRDIISDSYRLVGSIKVPSEPGKRLGVVSL